jgi:hypothetical protein
MQLTAITAPMPWNAVSQKNRGVGATHPPVRKLGSATGKIVK